MLAAFAFAASILAAMSYLPCYFPHHPSLASKRPLLKVEPTVDTSPLALTLFLAGPELLNHILSVQTRVDVGVLLSLLSNRRSQLLDLFLALSAIPFEVVSPQLILSIFDLRDHIFLLLLVDSRGALPFSNLSSGR